MIRLDLAMAHGRRLVVHDRTAIMGIVNVTPDSFSDGGRFFAPEAALRQAARLVEDGADVLDIGGESTRPGAPAVSEADELARVLPVIEAIRSRFDVPISIDTTKANVARAAVRAGADIVNDVSAFTLDPDMAATCAELGAGVILMHMKGTPRTMQQNPEYKDVVTDIFHYLEERIRVAKNAGISASAILIDPGIGFGKTRDHNYVLMAQLARFGKLAPVLLGTSRKTFIRNTVARNDQTPAPDSPEVLHGTQATTAAAAFSGTAMVRVHDVAAARALLAVADIIHTTRQG